MDTSTGSKRDVAKTSIPSRHHRSNERQYVFDTTFGADSTQQEVYEKTTQHLVKSVLDGFHATVFAYGATGSGKTFCTQIHLFRSQNTILSQFCSKVHILLKFNFVPKYNFAPKYIFSPKYNLSQNTIYPNS